MKATFEVPDSVAISFFKGHLNGVESSGVYNARCPVCGDSQRNKSRKRLYMLKKKRVWIVYCHNCDYSASLLNFAKDFFPSQYDFMLNQSINDFLFATNVTKKDKDIELKKIINIGMKKINTNTKTKIELYIEQNCIPLCNKSDDVRLAKAMEEQIQYFKSRKLKQDFIESLYYCFDEKYVDRIIIPFFDNNRRIYYFQARGTRPFHKANKYINWTDDEIDVERMIYNEHFVDIEQTVYMTEGIIDSLFVKNCVALMGVKMSRERYNKIKKMFPKRVWIMDNDFTGKLQTKKLLDMNESCFVFPKKFTQKDLNEVAISLDKDDLTEIIEQYSYNSIEGIIQLGKVVK